MRFFFASFLSFFPGFLRIFFAGFLRIFFAAFFSFFLVFLAAYFGFFTSFSTGSFFVAGIFLTVALRQVDFPFCDGFGHFFVMFVSVNIIFFSLDFWTVCRHHITM